METKDNSKHHHSFSADRPIVYLAEDRLGRRSFAEALSKAITGWKGRDSLVIALYGAWGTGKSSVKNMVSELLRNGHGVGTPEVVDFNPWQVANREKLAEAFFEQIEVALRPGRRGKNRDRKALLRKWRNYSAYLKAGAGLVDLSKSGVPLALLFIAVVLFGVGLSEARTFALFSAVFILILAGILRWSSKAAGYVADLLQPGSEVGELGLETIKRDLADALRTLEAPLLVVIDDVDRLTPNEVQQLFQLIKANADFPNVVYFVLFERAVVEKSLEKALDVDGRAYLEKIVQVGFDMPLIQPDKLYQVLFDGLDQQLSDRAVSKRFDKQRWGNLFHGGLKPYFTTLRDVNRFLSTVSFHVSLFRGDTSFEVNPVDLIGLEVLRVFHPEVYRFIASNKTLMTGGFREHDNHNEHRREIRAMFDPIDEKRRPAVQEIIKQLFPTVEWALEGSSYSSSFHARWFRDLRVCSGEVFDRYFRLQIADNDVSQAQIDRLLTATGDRGSLRKELTRLAECGLLKTALDRWESYIDDIPLEHAESFTTALFDMCDLLPSRSQGMYELWPLLQANRLVYFLLKREPGAARRLDVLKNSIRATDGIRLPIDVVSLESQKLAKGERGQDCLVDECAIEDLKKLCVSRIESASANGRLNDIRGLRSILYHWKTWAGESGPRAFVEGLMQETVSVCQFLREFLSMSTSHGMGDYVAREHWYITLAEIETFVPWELVQNATRDLSLDSLPSDDDRRALESFRRAVERRQQGKPDFGGGYDSGDDDD